MGISEGVVEMMERAQYKILIVDDDSVSRGVVTRWIGGHGYTTIIAVNGEEAVAIATEILPSLILLDVVMPIMDGYDACKILKAQESTKDIPVVFMTSQPRAFSAPDAFRVGGADYVPKPIQQAELLARIDTHIKLATAMDILKRSNDYLNDFSKVQSDKYFRIQGRFLQKQEEYKAILDNITDAIVVLNEAKEITQANASAKALYPFADSDPVGECCKCMYSSDVRCDCPVDKAKLSGLPETGSVRDDTGKMWSNKAFPVKYENDETRYVVVTREVTAEVKEREKNIRTAQLTALGELAANVAHEVNNPLNCIMSAAQIATSFSENEKTAEFLNVILDNTERISTIIKDMLSFARGRKDSQFCSVSDILSGITALMRAQLLKDQIDLKIEIQEDTPLIFCNRQRIQQVVLNVMQNARHALNRKFGAQTEGKEIILKVWGGDDGVVRFSFKDNGEGISKESVKKVFAPFYTTKPQDEGTGLGLSISKGIIEEHGGSIEIESEYGLFTIVNITIPISGGVS